MSLLLFSGLAIYAQRYRITIMRTINNNSEKEFAPVWIDKDKEGIVFLSNKTIPSTKKFVTKESGQPLSDIYYAEFDGENKTTKPVEFSPIITTDADDGPVCFAQDGNMMCVALQHGYAKGVYMSKNGNSGLYFLYKENGKWGNKLTPFEYNDIYANFSTPFLTKDGRTLYFAGQGLPENYGGWDIYVSEFDGTSWSEPENLGNTINTSEWELYPFYLPSGRLYFSSRGHQALGGSFDLFSSTRTEDSWRDPVPVPSLNSFNDEFSLIINDDFSEGYFTRKTLDDYNILKFQYPNYESFDKPMEIKPNRFCYRLRENSLDTIDYNMFHYEWVINDTLTLEGHEIKKYCFPGPGFYQVNFNVTNKITDTTMYKVASLRLNLELIQQPVITAPDTARVGENINFRGNETAWERWPIEGYYWDFGNGVQEKGINVNYQYLEPGEYTVVLGIKEKTKSRRFQAEKTSVFKKIVILGDQ